VLKLAVIGAGLILLLELSTACAADALNSMLTATPLLRRSAVSPDRWIIL